MCVCVWPAREDKPRFGAAPVRSAHDCETRLLWRITWHKFCIAEIAAKCILVVVVKWCHHANVLFLYHRMNTTQKHNLLFITLLTFTMYNYQLFRFYPWFLSVGLRIITQFHLILWYSFSSLYLCVKWCSSFSHGLWRNSNCLVLRSYQTKTSLQ